MRIRIHVTGQRGSGETQGASAKVYAADMECIKIKAVLLIKVIGSDPNCHRSFCFGAGALPFPLHTAHYSVGLKVAMVIVTPPSPEAQQGDLMKYPIYDAYKPDLIQHHKAMAI